MWRLVLPWLPVLLAQVKGCGSSGGSGPAATPVLLDSSSGPITYYLPSGPTLYQEVPVKDVGGAAETNNITIATLDGSLIDGLSSYVFNQNRQQATFEWLGEDAGGWGIF